MFKKKHSIWIKYLVISVVCLFLVNDVAFAISQLQSYTLAPPSPFNPNIKRVNGIRDEIKFTMEDRGISVHGDDERKWAFWREVEKKRIYKRINGIPGIGGVLNETIADLYDMFVERIKELRIDPGDFTAVLSMELFYEQGDIVVNVVHNGKKAIDKDGTPIKVYKNPKEHFGGIGYGNKYIKTIIDDLGGGIQLRLLEGLIKIEIRIPKKPLSEKIKIDKKEYIYIENEEEKARWDDELIRVIKDGVIEEEGKAKGGQAYSGKHFVNSTAFYVISKIIGDDLHDPIELEEPVVPEARAKALSKLIRENIDPVELAMSKTRHDPILKGFEIDELRYNKKNDSYELPIYREGKEKFYYKFYVAEKPKGPDDWRMVPLSDSKNVYMRVKKSPEPETEEALAQAGRPEHIQKMLDDAVKTLKNLLTKAKTHKLSRRAFIAAAATVVVSPGTVVKASVAAVNEKLLGEFFDLIKGTIEQHRELYGSGGVLEQLANKGIKKAEGVGKAVRSLSNRLDGEIHVMEMYIGNMAVIRRDIREKVKESEERVAVLEKYLQAKTGKAENKRIKEWLKEFTALHWVRHKRSPDVPYEEARQRVYQQIEAFPDEIRARALYAICRNELKSYRWVMDEVFKPAVIKLKSTIEMLKKLDELDSGKRKVEQVTEEETSDKEKCISPESEQTHAVKLVRTIKHVQAKPESKLSFIALGTNRLYGRKEEDPRVLSVVNPLVTSIRNYCQENGILFIDGDDDKVAKVVGNIKRDYKEARGVVLADEEAINTLENYLTTIGLKDDRNIFLAGINDKNLTPDKLTADSYYYIRFVEMLNLTIKLLGGKSINEQAIKTGHPKLGFRVINKRRITFEPDAEAMPYEDLKKICDFQEFA